MNSSDEPAGVNLGSNNRIISLNFNNLMMKGMAIDIAR